MGITKMYLDEFGSHLSYEEVLQCWKEDDHSNPFSGHLLTRLTSELNQIEGINVSYNLTREILDSETVSNYSGDIRDLYSVLNSRQVANYLNAEFSKGSPISVPLIKEVHRLLMFGSMDNHRYHDNGERAGEFKKKEYCVGRYDVGAPASEVEGLLMDLCDICNSTESDYLKIATVFHCYFQHIHPFADGNGRTGRWLTNYLLLLNGHPPAVYIAEEKKEYYKALEIFDRDEDYCKMYEWLKRCVVKGYRAWR